MAPGVTGIISLRKKNKKEKFLGVLKQKKAIYTSDGEFEDEVFIDFRKFQYFSVNENDAAL